MVEKLAEKTSKEIVDSDTTLTVGAFAVTELVSHNRVVATHKGDTSGTAFKANTFNHSEPHEACYHISGKNSHDETLHVGAEITTLDNSAPRREKTCDPSPGAEAREDPRAVVLLLAEYVKYGVITTRNLLILDDATGKV